MQVLVAPSAFGGALRASVVAAAIGRGLEAAGLEPPDLCPLADGGPGTLEVLLGRLGGETAAAMVGGRRVGYALLDDGATALVEAAGSGGVGALIAAAVAAGAEAVVVAVGGAAAADGALAGAGGARLIVLGDERTPAPGEADWTRSGGGLAGALRDSFGAEVRSGARFVLDALDFDARMRAARAVIVGAGRLDAGVLDGRAPAEAATRARQAGVPAHAIVGVNALDRFDARILDLQEMLTATTPAELQAAAHDLAARL